MYLLRLVLVPFCKINQRSAKIRGTRSQPRLISGSLNQSNTENNSIRVLFWSVAIIHKEYNYIAACFLWFSYLAMKDLEVACSFCCSLGVSGELQKTKQTSQVSGLGFPDVHFQSKFQHF